MTENAQRAWLALNIALLLFGGYLLFRVTSHSDVLVAQMAEHVRQTSADAARLAATVAVNRGELLVNRAIIAGLAAGATNLPCTDLK